MRKLLVNKVILVIALLLTGLIIFIKATPVKKPPTIAKFEKSLPAVIDYNLHVKPILSDKCFLCHGPDKNNGQKAGLNLSNSEGARALLKDGSRAIVPGSLSRSELYNRIISTDDDLVMPTRASNRVLTDYEKAILIKWIEQGAVYKPHWAFIAPVKHELPGVNNKSWPKNGIDYFILHKLEENGLKPAPVADKETLLRRVTLDLTGLNCGGGSVTPPVVTPPTVTPPTVAPVSANLPTPAELPHTGSSLSGLLVTFLATLTT